MRASVSSSKSSAPPRKSVEFTTKSLRRKKAWHSLRQTTNLFNAENAESSPHLKTYKTASILKRTDEKNSAVLDYRPHDLA